MAAQGFYSERRRDRDVVRARGRINSDTGFRETGPAQFPSRGTVNFQPEDDLGPSRISAVDLYRGAELISPALFRALMLLGQAIDRTLEGIRSAAEGDPVGSDLHVQALRPVLRKLFMCRAIGDGFGAIVDALISALENNRGQPLETLQLQALQDTLVRLRREPFLSFANAIRLVEDVERVGFSTQPPGFEQLADWLTV